MTQSTAVKVIWKVVEAEIKIESFMRLPHGPVYWVRDNVKPKPTFRLHTPRQPSLKNKLIWAHYTSIYLGTCILTPLVLLLQLFQKEPSLSDLQIFVYAFQFALVVVTMAPVFFASLSLRKDIVCFYNKLIAMNNEDNSTDKETKKPPGKESKRDKLKEKVIQLAVLTLVADFLIIQNLLPFLALYLEVDQAFYFYKHYLPPEIFKTPRHYRLLMAFRFLYTFLFCAELGRDLLHIFVTAVLSLLLYDDSCKTLLKKLKKFKSTNNTLQDKYTHLFLIFEALRPYASVVLASIMGGGLIVLILVNFVTIRKYSVVPMPVFLVFPMDSILGMIFGATSLHLIVNTLEFSRYYKRLWKQNLKTLHSSTHKKYWRLKIDSLGDLLAHGGILGFRLYPVQRYIISAYASATIDNSINAILTVP